MVEDIVQADQLVKRFGTFTAVGGISMGIRAGECFGMLGPNGAGKTTTVRMIQCVSPVTSGRLTVLGFDTVQGFRQIKALIGVCPQEDNLDPDFTVETNLRVYARYFSLQRSDIAQRVEKLLDFAALRDRRHDKILALSGGMKRRLTIARALINTPRLLLLDEPTTGLDPQARHLIWDRIRELREQGTTIILTTHYMEEAAQLCDRIVIMDNGRILDQGSPPELVARHIGREVLEVRQPDRQLQQRLGQAAGEPFEQAGSRLLFRTDKGAELLARLQQTDVPLDHYILRPASLEDVFLHLTGRELKE